MSICTIVCNVTLVANNRQFDEYDSSNHLVRMYLNKTSYQNGLINSVLRFLVNGECQFSKLTYYKCHWHRLTSNGF